MGKPISRLPQMPVDLRRCAGAGAGAAAATDRGIECGGNRAEHGGQRGAHLAQCDHRRDRDESRDEPVLDGGGARLVLKQTP